MELNTETLLAISLIVLFGQLIGGVLFGGKSATDTAQLARIEKKLDLLLKHEGIEIPLPSVPAEIDELLMVGNKIAAIKRYRELNPGMGLKEAKDAVEEYARSKGL